jgi:2-polyprenyl-6-methoxyphenol hydroxylase-like FAD-dependent oxidoreductase
MLTTFQDQGQGGGQAIEDGAALGPLFELGTKREHVKRVLELWQQVRKERATKVEWLSRTQAAGTSTLPREIPSLSTNCRLTFIAFVSQSYIFGHDVMEYAKLTRSSELLY